MSESAAWRSQPLIGANGNIHPTELTNGAAFLAGASWLARTSSLLATWRFSPVGEAGAQTAFSLPIRARESAVTIRTMRSSGAGVSALVDTRLSRSRPITAGAAGSKPGRPRERRSPLRHPLEEVVVRAPRFQGRFHRGRGYRHVEEVQRRFEVLRLFRHEVCSINPPELYASSRGLRQEPARVSAVRYL
jgi:hypothetical protein